MTDYQLYHLQMLLKYLAVMDLYDYVSSHLPTLWLHFTLSLQLILGSHLEPMEGFEEDEEGLERADGISSPTLPACGVPTCSRLSQTHRLVLTPHWTRVLESPYKLPIDSSLLAAFTQVSLNH